MLTLAMVPKQKCFFYYIAPIPATNRASNSNGCLFHFAIQVFDPRPFSQMFFSSCCQDHCPFTCKYRSGSRSASKSRSGYTVVRGLTWLCLSSKSPSDRPNGCSSCEPHKKRRSFSIFFLLHKYAMTSTRLPLASSAVPFHQFP